MARDALDERVGEQRRRWCGHLITVGVRFGKRQKAQAHPPVGDEHRTDVMLGGGDEGLGRIRVEHLFAQIFNLCLDAGSVNGIEKKNWRQ